METRKKIALAVVGIAGLICIVTAVQLVGREARWVDVGTLVAAAFAVGVAVRSMVPARRR